MRNSSKTGMVVVAFIALALLLGAGLGLWVSRQGAGPTIEMPPTVVSIKTVVANSNAVAAAHVAQTNDVAASTNTDEMQPPAGWEQKLDDILISDTDEANKAAQILALMPTATEEGKVELAQHLVNLVQDENYTSVGDLLSNPTTPKDVSNVLMNDLLNRNNNLKLPLLLAVARNDDHPLKSEAKDLLELFIQEDKGTNWTDWETAVDKWLKDNQPPPDTSAPEGMN